MKTKQRSNDDPEAPIWKATIKVGQNAKENDVLFCSAKQNDIWFHLDKGPSCHVYLSIVYGMPPKHNLVRLISECEDIVRANSKCAPNAKVIHAEKRNIRKVYGKEGEVVVASHRGKNLTWM